VAGWGGPGERGSGPPRLLPRLRATGREPFLIGLLFEDNVFFTITGEEQAATAYVERLAEELGVRV